jgi:acetoin utilization deacetylase AcuC-like enzyme
LHIALTRIQEFNAEAVVISMGLDTHDSDPCALPGAGFCLEGKDYWKLGNSMSLSLRQRKVIIIQEGGYRMDKIGEAATNVILGFMD